MLSLQVTAPGFTAANNPFRIAAIGSSWKMSEELKGLTVEIVSAYLRNNKILPIAQHVGNGSVAESRRKPAMPENFSVCWVVRNDMTGWSSGGDICATRN